MHRFGQLALKLNAIELAEFAFERCLRCNASHWSAADGMLRTLCENHNIIGAYGYALKLYNRDPSYERAAKTLYEIADTFKYSLPLCENIYGPMPKTLKPLISWTKESVFPRKYRNENIENNEENTTLPTEIVQKICIKELNWVTVGQYITALYRYMQANDKVFIVLLSLKDMLTDSNTASNIENLSQHESTRQVDLGAATISNSNQVTLDTANELPECNSNNLSNQNSNIDFPVGSTTTAAATTQQTTNDGEQIKKNAENSVDEVENYEKTNASGDTINKPQKPRRRCSDLHFLEQWGWHKNRRYSSRKKTTTEKVEVDTSIKGFLSRIFAKYSSATYEMEWPFGCAKNNDSKSSDEKCSSCHKIMTNEEFQDMSRDNFNELIAKLETKSLDPPLLVFEWLKSISSFWTKALPEDIRALYLEIFCIYIDNFDCSPWNQQTVEAIETFYRISILFLELDYAIKNLSNDDLSPIWKQVFDQLAFRSGTALVALGQKFNKYKLRIINLEYLWFDIRNEFEKCIACLAHIEEIILLCDGSQFILHLPNLNANCITINAVQEAQSDFRRRISLAKIPKLFEQEKWQEVVQIITDNLAYEVEVDDCENWLKNLKTQVEILLESFWNMSALEECMKWAEKSLHYCIHKYIKESDKARQQELWAVALNFIYSYIEVLLLNEGTDILFCLEDFVARLVQNTISVLSFHLDSNQPLDKSNNPEHEFNMKRPFVILHQIILRDENNVLTVVKPKTANNAEEEEDPLPGSFSLLFTAHDFLGKYQCCTRNNGEYLHYILDIIVPIIRAPLYDSCRDTLYEYIEQVTFCLYGYPQKKARSRHLEHHEATNVELTWTKAIQAFDLYRPECLPEINSYKLESITADLEQFFLKIVAIMPTELDPTPQTTKILDFIKGNNFNTLEPAHTSLPYKIRSVFYLLADYYFKNRDFSKAIKYYTLDLTISPTRFDSWAGMALSKASKIETRLNCLNPLNPNNVLAESEDTIRCFEMCICLNRRQILLWIEYGSFTYTLHSYCSRQLKNSPDTLTAEQSSLLQARKGRVLNISNNCFSLAAALQNSEETEDFEEENEDAHEEKWLCQYMLGKIAEKQKDHPKTYLNCYLQAANNLYEANATYPIKINHSNPTTLSVEALEVFYRTNAAIIKFLAKQKEISRDIGNQISNVLKSLASSPFAFNKAKIDGNSLNALKRKVIVDKTEQVQLLKTCPNKKPNCDPNCSGSTRAEAPNENVEEQMPKDCLTEPSKVIVQQAQELNIEKATTSCKSNPSRRESEESGVTVTTTTITTSSTTSVTSGTDSTSSSETDSDSDGSSNDSKKLNTPYPAYKVENIYKIVLQNLEECVTRFPEHYKSIYRLAYHYKNTNLPNLKNLKHCEELLIGHYKTKLDNQIDGVFYDRKWNNIFNGIWRIPSSEIDRPGNFATHLVKCTAILIELLYENKNHKLLIDVGLQLYKTPEQDKRYIKDCERVKLSHSALNYCAQIMRDILKENIENRNDIETLNLLIDIYKVHKKCLKYMNQKEILFTELMVDVYKFYIQNKVENIPENLNFLDLAIKLCLHEIAVRRNQEKASMSESDATMQTMMSSQATQAMNTKPKQIHIPGLTMRQRGRSSLNKPADGGFGSAENLTNANSISQVTTPSNESIWLHLLRSQYPSLDTQQMRNASKPFVESKPNDQLFMKEMIEQYKAIFKSIQNEQRAANSTAMPATSTPLLPPTSMSTNPMYSSISSLPSTALTPNPIFLSTALPMETTITPSISKNYTSTSTTTPTTTTTFTTINAGAQALANYDITITPFCNAPSMSILPTSATSSSSSIETSNSKPTTISSSSGNINSTIDMMNISPFLYNVCPPPRVSSANALPPQIPTTNLAMSISGGTGGGVDILQNAQEFKKQLNAANTAIVNPFANFGGDALYNQQMQMIMNLMQDANKFQLQELQAQQQKQRTATKRKSKLSSAAGISSVNAINMNNVSPNTASTTATANVLQQQQIQLKQEPLSSSPTKTMLSENHPLFCPTIDLVNSATISAAHFAAISQQHVNTLSSNTLPNQFATAGKKMQQTAATFSQQQQTPAQTSQQQISTSQPTTPTKTLQQKLAERKKANQQQNEKNLNTNTEVIILD
ncbi:calcineurin-binding protein cabin-1-like isoform X2 [Eurosta solidaginis]